MGTHFPVGGMHAISQSLTKLAQELGVQFELSSMVEHILVEENKVQGVMVNGTERMFDLVVCNSDIKHAYHELLPKQVRRPKKTLAQEPSSSALIFYWGIGQTFPEMDLHNIIII